MKYLFFTFSFLIFTFGNAQITLIPDPNFEQALIDLGIDTDGVINGQLLTSDAQNATSIFADDYGISDLTGIEDFTSLEEIDIYQNEVSILDFSNNPNLKFVDASFNPISSVNFTQNGLLENFYIGNTGLDPNPPIAIVSEIDVSNNPNLIEFSCVDCPNLTTIDVSNNPNLQYFNFAYCNVSEIDVSQNPLLLGFAASLPFNPIGSNPNLTSLDFSNNPNLEILIVYGTNIESPNVKNGNNGNFINFDARLTQNLSCIEVDNPEAANNNQAPYNSWQVDPQTNYAIDCQLSINDNEIEASFYIYPNPATSVLNIKSSKPLDKVAFFDVTGQLISKHIEGSNKISLNHLTSGLYIVEIVSNDFTFFTKIIKK